MEDIIKADSKMNFIVEKKYKSIFIKKGKIMKERDRLPYFDFANFEKLKLKGTNQYHILGSGAFGEVFLAKNKIDGKLFAIKQMEKAKLNSVGIQPEVIYREINIHMELLHEHIVRLYSYHEDNKAFYLIIDYAENGTLFQIIQSNKGLSEKSAFKYFIQVASAINFLHENNLMHRDLKPENCLVDKEGNIKICDFGWTAEGGKANRVTFCGTYEYMAPEIIKEMPYNFAVDVWSLGVLLYELLHSYSPFRSKTKNILTEIDINKDPSLEVLRNIIKYNFKIEKVISTECKDLLFKLLSPNSNERILATDIFNHPWVLKFEKNITEKTKIVNQKFLKNRIFNEKDNRNPFENKKNENETVLKEISPSDTLFNTVIEQIQGTHKKKQKTSKLHTLNCNENMNNKKLELSTYNNVKDKENENPNNKIVLKMEKPENIYIDNNKVTPNLEENNKNKNILKDNQQTLQFSPIKREVYDESNFSMFKELNEIDRQIYEKSKQLETIKKKAHKMIQIIEKISLNTKTNKSRRNDHDTNLLENLNTQPQSVLIEEAVNSVLNNKDSNKSDRKNCDSSRIYNKLNYNEDIFFNNETNKIKSKNKKYKRSKSKNVRQDQYWHKNSKESELLETNLVEDQLNLFEYQKEISTQTESPASFWTKIFGIFKCG